MTLEPGAGMGAILPSAYTFCVAIYGEVGLVAMTVLPPMVPPVYADVVEGSRMVPEVG